MLFASGHKSLRNNLSGYPVEVTFNVKNVETFRYIRENDLLPKKLQLGSTDLPWPWVLNHNELVELYHFVSTGWNGPLIYNGLYNMACWHLLMIQIISHEANLALFFWEPLILSGNVQGCGRHLSSDLCPESSTLMALSGMGVWENAVGPNCPLIWPVAPRFNIGNTWSYYRGTLKLYGNDQVQSVRARSWCLLEIETTPDSLYYWTSLPRGSGPQGSTLAW